MSKSFSAQIDDIIAKSEKRMLGVMRQSLQDTVNEAQTPVAKGGRMRVDTGFLRASGQASLNGMPSGPGRGARDGTYNFNENNVVVTLGNMKFGQTFFFGWTANYARYREMYDGFLITALQNWQKTVDHNVEKLKALLK